MSRHIIGYHDDRLTVYSWWFDGDEADIPEPWETFTLVLHGEEAGDTMSDWSRIKKVLDSADIMIIRRSTGLPFWSPTAEEQGDD